MQCHAMPCDDTSSRVATGFVVDHQRPGNARLHRPTEGVRGSNLLYDSPTARLFVALWAFSFPVSFSECNMIGVHSGGLNRTVSIRNTLTGEKRTFLWRGLRNVYERLRTLCYVRETHIVLKENESNFHFKSTFAHFPCSSTFPKKRKKIQQSAVQGCMKPYCNCETLLCLENTY